VHDGDAHHQVVPELGRFTQERTVTATETPPHRHATTARPDAQRAAAESGAANPFASGGSATAAFSTGQGLDRVVVGAVDALRRYPLLIGVVASTFLFVKVIRVSHTDPATALTLLSSADASTITLGGALSLLYTLTTLGIVCGLDIVGRKHDEVTGHVAAAMGLLALALAAALVLLPVQVLAAIALLAVFVRAAESVSRRLPFPAPGNGLTTRTARLAAVTAAAVATAVMVWSLVDDTPWVAPERLTTTDGTVVGYVVGSLRFTVDGLDEPGSYKADVTVGVPGAQDGVTSAVTLLRRRSWLAALGLLVVGVAHSQRSCDGR
jgi:hypothetical protein